jgi:hypothetical protein
VANSSRRTVSFAELRRSIDDLYKSHPGVESFVTRDVAYTPATRDKVLSVCRRGGPETDPGELESVRLAGCAPLIFFFYSYGRQKKVPESIDVARQIYWYAVRNVRGPFDSGAALRGLLQTWGIQ